MGKYAFSRRIYCLDCYQIYSKYRHLGVCLLGVKPDQFRGEIVVS